MLLNFELWKYHYFKQREYTTILRTENNLPKNNPNFKPWKYTVQNPQNNPYFGSWEKL